MVYLNYPPDIDTNPTVTTGTILLYNVDGIIEYLRESRI